MKSALLLDFRHLTFLRAHFFPFVLVLTPFDPFIFPSFRVSSRGQKVRFFFVTCLKPGCQKRVAQSIIYKQGGSHKSFPSYLDKRLPTTDVASSFPKNIPFSFFSFSCFFPAFSFIPPFSEPQRWQHLYV